MASATCDAATSIAAARPTHAKWLKQYLPLVEEGTWAWLEIGDSDLFGEPLPSDVVASAFANRRVHLVLANYGNAAREIVTADAYRAAGDGAAAPNKHWNLPARSLHILQQAAG